MKLLLVSPYFPPQPSIASRRTHAYAAAWRNAGHDVTVLTTQKRPDQRGLELPCDGLELVEIPFQSPRMLERFRVVHKERQFASPHAPTSRGQSRNRITKALLRLRDESGIYSTIRMPDLTDYWVKPAVKWCASQSNRTWDAMISSCGPYTAHLTARRIKQQNLARIWAAEFRDLWTQNHIQRGLFPFTIRERMLETKCLREADLLITVSEVLASKLRQRSGKEVQIIYNGFDAVAINAIPADRIFPCDDKFRIVFTGTLYTRQQGLDPTPLLRAMSSLQRSQPAVASRICLVVAGQGGEMWAELAAQFNLRNSIDIRGLVSGTDALRLQRDGDALLLLDNINPEHGVLSGKAFEYLAVTAPVLVVGGGSESAMGKLIENARRGINVACDAERIQSILMKLIENPSNEEFAGDREFIQQFSREKQSLRLLDLLSNMHVNSN